MHTTEQTIFIIQSVTDLPGHELGRQRLVAATHGEEIAVKVAGRWKGDEFVVEQILDARDADGDWAVADCGSDMFPQAVEA